MLSFLASLLMSLTCLSTALSADFDCNYYQMFNKDSTPQTMAIPADSCLTVSDSANDSEKYSNSSKCTYDTDNSIEFIYYDHERSCNTQTNSTKLNNATASSMGIEYSCNINASPCSYVSFLSHGPHPIKCDDYYHIWEQQTFVTGCYKQIIDKYNHINNYKSAYYGCNTTNIIIEYYSSDSCQGGNNNILQTQIIESCECNGADCYSYQIQECTDPKFN